MSHSDVLVIGGGVAGLSAAQQLLEGDLSVTLLEAQDRLGGRVRSLHVPHYGVALELGAEWLDASGDVKRLLRQKSIETRVAEGHRWERVGDTYEKLDNLGHDLEPLLARITQVGNADRSVREALRAVANGSRWDKAREELLDYIQGFHAADPDRMSVRWLVEVEKNQSADASQLRVPGGLDQMIAALTPEPNEKFALHLGTVVREVRWQPGEVEVIALHDGVEQRFTAKSAVVTLPAAIMRVPSGAAGHVRFAPGLTSRRDPLQYIVTGNVIKVVLGFDSAFWESVGGLDELLFLMNPGVSIPTWWTTRPDTVPLMIGWVGGPQADKLSGLSEEALLSEALTSLAAALGRPREEVESHLRDWHHHDWENDPYARGAYSYVAEGGIDAPEALARPIANTLFFAGEATCEKGYNATVEGALRSGRRAGKEVLAQRD